MKINILGTDYRIIKTDDIPDEADGDCNFYGKIIRVKPVESMLDESATYTEKEKRFWEVCTHEIVHAYLFESGCDEWAYNEDLVNWISMQFHKIVKSTIEISSIIEM